MAVLIIEIAWPERNRPVGAQIIRQHHGPHRPLVRVPDEVVERRIYLIRGVKVMLDSDLAGLYGVTTGNLNLAVRRNAERFPPDFMFQLTDGRASRT